jgi:hypothetical protein
MFYPSEIINTTIYNCWIQSQSITSTAWVPTFPRRRAFMLVAQENLKPQNVHIS